MLRQQFNFNIGIKIGSKDIGLVAAQVIIEAYNRMMNGYALRPYIHTHKRAGVQACGRAGVRACRRAGVRAWTK